MAVNGAYHERHCNALGTEVKSNDPSNHRTKQHTGFPNKEEPNSILDFQIRKKIKDLLQKL